MNVTGTIGWSEIAGGVLWFVLVLGALWSLGESTDRSTKERDS